MATVRNMNRSRIPTITGEAFLVSPLFSSRWRLVQDDRVIAELRRLGRIYVSTADLGPAGRLVLEPAGQGTVCAVDERDEEVARIVRTSWLGRRFEISGLGYRYELVSDPRPRRWHIEIAHAPVTEITGSLVSYNNVRVRSSLAIPVPAVLLAWHVVARPWEAAAEPRGLLPAAHVRSHS
jgi:hypothetical protein